MIYLKRTGSPLWHYCSACSHWPQRVTGNNGIIMTEQAPTADICNECVARTRAGTCEPLLIERTS